MNNLERLAKINKELLERERRTLISQETAELAIEAGHIGVWDWHIGTGRLHWNRWMFVLFGYGQERFEATITTFIDKVRKEDRAGVIQAIEHSKKTGKRYFIEYSTLEGRRIWARGVWILDSGKPLRMLGVCIEAKGPKVD
jgi:PAS domain-containing protein